MIKTYHSKDENGDDAQEVIHCILPENRRYVYIKRHNKFQGRDIYFEDGKKSPSSEIFGFNQALWDQLAVTEIGQEV